MYGGQRTGFGSGSGGLGGGGGGGGAGGGIGGTGGVSAWADWAARNLDVDVQQTPVQGYVGE